jgi:hypothetical protein
VQIGHPFGGLPGRLLAREAKLTGATYVFTNWLCGGGVKGGISHGPSDEWGYKPADCKDPTEVYDVHATVLHLLGIDHERLNVRHNGIDRRQTDVHGHVIRPLLT